LGEHGPETEEPSECPWDFVVLSEWSRVAPVFETVLGVIRSTACSNDDTEDDQTGDGDNLDRSEPELAFAVNTGTEEMEIQRASLMVSFQ